MIHAITPTIKAGSRTPSALLAMKSPHAGGGPDGMACASLAMTPMTEIPSVTRTATIVIGQGIAY